MNSHHTTIRDLTGNPHLEALEIADVRGRTGLPDDVQAEMEAAFGYGTERDEMTEREIDALAEMERRERESHETFCGTTDDGDGDEPPTPPAGGALRPGSIMAAAFGCYGDDDLILAVHCIDAGKVQNITEAQQQQLLDAATRELLRRLDARRPRQAA